MNIENLCQICRENSSPYKCPKCRRRYCSLNCYRDESHQQCVDEFDEFDTTKTTTTNNFVRERIEEILKRKLDEKDFHDEENDENIDELLSMMNEKQNEPGEDEEERILSDQEEEEEEENRPELPDDFDESDEKTTELWNILTSEEKREFETMLKDGRISHLLNDYKPWKPWWLYKTSAPPLISDVETPIEPVNFPSTIPSVDQPIVPLTSLTSILPHVNVRLDLFEILFAYVFINVRFRGEFSSHLIESSNEFFTIATRHLTSMSSDERLSTRISFLRQLSLRISEEFFINLIEDVRKIVHGPFQREKSSNHFVLSALSDLKRFLNEFFELKTPVELSQAEKNVFHPNFLSKKPKKTTKVRSTSKKNLQNLRRKVDYLLSWSTSYADRLLILEFELEHVENDLRHRLDEYQREKSRIEKNFSKIRVDKSKSRIEEL